MIRDNPPPSASICVPFLPCGRQRRFGGPTGKGLRIRAVHVSVAACRTATNRKPTAPLNSQRNNPFLRSAVTAFGIRHCGRTVYRMPKTERRKPSPSPPRNREQAVQAATRTHLASPVPWRVAGAFLRVIELSPSFSGVVYAPEKSFTSPVSGVCQECRDPNLAPATPTNNHSGQVLSFPAPQ